MITKDDTRYSLDLQNIMNFVFEDEYKRTNDSEITESYIKDDNTHEMVLINKQLREIKGSENSAKFTIRYDMIKMLIDIAVNIDQNSPTTGEELIFNTLYAENLIKVIN